MVFINKTRSLPSLNSNRIENHTDHSDYDVTIGRSARCKACCKSCRRVCPRILAKCKLQPRPHHQYGRNNNFVLLSARYLAEFYRWSKKYLFTDDFLKSVVASTILFAIGVKLTIELNACNL